MAPFIKLTERIEAADGEKTRFHFINVALVTRAIYVQDDNTLQIIVASCEDKGSYDLKGDEAREALKILREVK